MTIAAQRAGPTSFIALVDLEATNIAALTNVSYEIQARPGTASRPVRVGYTMAGLQARHRVSGSTITLPVFGLYANYSNTASITVTYNDSSSKTLSASIVTPDYKSPLYTDTPQVNLARAQGVALGFDFYAVKPASPNGANLTVYDSDGYIRWVTTAGTGSAALFRDNGFDTILPNGSAIRREELDGSSTSIIPNPTVTLYHHDFGRGPNGIFAMPDLPGRVEDILFEVAPDGTKLKTWDMAQIIGDYMRSNGDDPSKFVRPGVDWFHMNSVIYDSSDRSIIISSRENFVIKLNYDSSTIKWILGDPAKYWFTLPSLREKALTFPTDALVPIGQHSLSLLSDGQVLMFNNGFQSANNPVGTPAGASRSYSAVTGFKVDSTAMVASPGLTFDDNKSVYSPICSSAYLAPDGSMLLTYSQAENFSILRIKGLNPNHETVFDISYATPAGCVRGWNSIIIPFENIQFNS